jgi:nucleoside phosphorylase
VASRMGVPWLEIRALSDLAGKDSRIDFARFVSEVANSSAMILRRLLPVLQSSLLNHQSGLPKRGGASTRSG